MKQSGIFKLVNALLAVAAIGAFCVSTLPVWAADDRDRAPSNPQHPRTLHFEDITANFTPSPEIKGFSFMPGVAFIDFNHDGLMDIFLVGGRGQANSLYRNNGDRTSTDVAAEAGVDDLGQTGIRSGVAVGDLNNDGCDDIYVAVGTSIVPGK